MVTNDWQHDVPEYGDCACPTQWCVLENSPQRSMGNSARHCRLQKNQTWKTDLKAWNTLFFNKLVNTNTSKYVKRIKWWGADNEDRWDRLQVFKTNGRNGNHVLLLPHLTHPSCLPRTSRTLSAYLARLARFALTTNASHLVGRMLLYHREPRFFYMFYIGEVGNKSIQTLPTCIQWNDMNTTICWVSNNNSSVSIYC